MGTTTTYTYARINTQFIVEISTFWANIQKMDTKHRNKIFLDKSPVSRQHIEFHFWCLLVDFFWFQFHLDLSSKLVFDTFYLQNFESEIKNRPKGKTYNTRTLLIFHSVSLFLSLSSSLIHRPFNVHEWKRRKRTLIRVYWMSINVIRSLKDTVRHFYFFKFICCSIFFVFYPWWCIVFNVLCDISTGEL